MNFFSPKLSYNPRRYTPELDGVRGIAILLVILFHCFPSSITGLGWIGVNLFFVLSGFLITGILVDSKGQNGYYVNFISRRILRIFPLYYLVLFVMLFLMPKFGGIGSGSDFDFYVQNQAWFWSYLQNWLYSFRGFPDNLILVHFWSLGVEEQFYLLWPLLILFTPKRYLLQVSIALCLLAIIFRLLPLTWFNFDVTYRYMNTFSRMDGLLIGGIIAQLARKDKKILEEFSVLVGFCGLIAFITGIIIKKSFSFLELPLYYTGIDLFMGLVLFLSISDVRWVRGILRTKPLIFLGKYSYGIYVYHYIIYITLFYKFGPWLSAHFKSFSPTMLMLLFGIITVVTSLIVSTLSYHLYESHFLKLKKYFHNKPPKIVKEEVESQSLNLSV